MNFITDILTMIYSKMCVYLVYLTILLENCSSFKIYLGSMLIQFSIVNVRCKVV